jgi:hypothetical protein
VRKVVRKWRLKFQCKEGVGAPSFFIFSACRVPEDVAEARRRLAKMVEEDPAMYPQATSLGFPKGFRRGIRHQENDKFVGLHDVLLHKLAMVRAAILARSRALQW